MRPQSVALDCPRAPVVPTLAPRPSQGSSAGAAAAPRETAAYFPDRFAGSTRLRDQVGMDQAAVNEAIKSAGQTRARVRGTRWGAGGDLWREAVRIAIGPLTERGPAGGLIIVTATVAEWGEPQRVDMTTAPPRPFSQPWSVWRGSGD